MKNEYLQAKLKEVPHEPGSYQMKDRNDEVIYVGKAKDLHNRVNSYFVGEHNFKTRKLVESIADFDFIVTKSEKEALILEINLIKKFRPKYNIQFMDDSSYPYIKLTREKYPRLMTARDLKKDRKARYFGPFPNVHDAEATLKLLRNLYPFRRCNHLQDKVCLYYHMGQCLGPCCHDVDPQVYDSMIADVTRFLNGDTKDVAKDLKDKMMACAERMEFEKAQEYKELLEAVNSVAGEQQNIEKDKQGDCDVFAWHADKGYLAIAGLLVRKGAILNKEYKIKPLYGDATEEFMSFIVRYYEDHPPTRRVLLPEEIDIDLISEVIDIPVYQPKKGHYRKLLKMAEDNARQQLELKFKVVERQDQVTVDAVNALSKIAGKEMKRVELFDNSHISGSFAVAACVVYEDGMPDKKSYRLFKLHTGNNDIESMKEVIYRRYFRLLSENGRMPDGIIVDGGEIQINAAKEIITSLGLQDSITIMGLVKDDRHSTESLMDDQCRTIEIDKNSGLFFLLTRMQDEVHRAAISYHRKLRSKAATKSVLDEVEGIGPKRKSLLLKKFGNFTNLKNAEVDEIAQHVPYDVAERVYEALHLNEKDG